jgi:hypothetical protein
MVTRTERGWGGHFILQASCLFRRNTLITMGDEMIVVSTVGAYKGANGRPMTIGSSGRYYETMVFLGEKQGLYIEAGEEIPFRSQGAICAESYDQLPEDVDNMADQMHEAVVAEMMEKLAE